ncbi:MAG: histidine phosphatase family protein [Candidatus Nanopelagicales bacterium]
MTLPTDLVFVRHGQSEANVVQRAEKVAIRSGDAVVVPPGFYDRHDWQFRLSPLGREQAEVAGTFFDGGLGRHFDVGYVSPHMRARETAALLGGSDFPWLIDDRLRERDWGVYGAVPRSERTELFPLTERQQQNSPWYAHFDGGESLASGVFARVRDFLGTLHRERADQRVIAVTHGEFMWTARYVLERMLPEEWEALDADKSKRIRNCTILEYTRRDPQTGDVQPTLQWRRLRYTDEPARSPHGGEWVRLATKRQFTGAQLEELVQSVPPLELG